MFSTNLNKCGNSEHWVSDLNEKKKMRSKKTTVAAKKI